MVIAGLGGGGCAQLMTYETARCWLTLAENWYVGSSPAVTVWVAVADAPRPLSVRVVGAGAVSPPLFCKVTTAVLANKFVKVTVTIEPACTAVRSKLSPGSLLPPSPGKPAVKAGQFIPPPPPPGELHSDLVCVNGHAPFTSSARTVLVVSRSTLPAAIRLHVRYRKSNPSLCAAAVYIARPPPAHVPSR